MTDEDDTETTLHRPAQTMRGLDRAEPVLHAVVVTDPEGNIRRQALDPAGLTIGRVAGNGLVLPGPEVSRQHARITLAGEQAMISDLGSTNGTWVEGRRIESASPLRPGTRFAIGRFALHYRSGPAGEMARAAELEAELERAYRYVQALLPAPIESGPVRAEWRFQPSAAVGGDVLGYGFLDDRRFAVWLVDVAGHGIGSALLAASVANALRGRLGPDPAEVLAGLNASFQMDSQGGLFFTAWYGVADLVDRRIDFAAAGHHPGYLLHGQAPPEPLVTRNLPIGIMPGTRYRTASAPLRPGSRLVLFSDGAFETIAPDGTLRGLADFLPLLSGPLPPGPGTADHLLQALRAAARPGPLDDDASILSLDFP